MTSRYVMTVQQYLLVGWMELFVPWRIAVGGRRSHQPYLIHVIGNFHYPCPGLFVVLILPLKLQDRGDGGVLEARLRSAIRQTNNMLVKIHSEVHLQRLMTCENTTHPHQSRVTTLKHWSIIIITPINTRKRADLPYWSPCALTMTLHKQWES